MTVKVTQVHDGDAGRREYRGTPEQVQAQFLVAYPWLRRQNPYHKAHASSLIPTYSLLDDIQRLGESQGLFVEVEQ